MSSQIPAPPSTNQTARELMELLGESEKTAHDALRQLRRVIASEGREFAMAMYRQAVETEAAGGLTYTHKGETRRRTLGGVFFWHVRQAIGSEKAAILMPTARMLEERQRAAKAAARLANTESGIAATTTKKPAPVAVKQRVPSAKTPPTKAPPVKAPPAPKARTAGKKRGPVKMPEVFHSVRTK